MAIKKILLVLQEAGSADELRETLSRLGIHKIETMTTVQDIHAHISIDHPEGIIIEIKQLDDDLLQQIRSINQSFTIPVILFTETDEDLIIEKAIKSGVATYIVGSLEAQRIQSILQVAVTRFAEVQKLKQDLTKTRAQLQERKVIDKAKGILMKHKQISEDESYQALRKMAMDKNKRIAEIAEGIVATFDLLS